MSLPYNAIARAQGWSPRGWFGLTEPQQVMVIRAATKSLGLFGTTLAETYPQPFASDPRVLAVLRTEGALRAEILRSQLEADARAAQTPASKPPAPAPAPAPVPTPTPTTTRTPTRTTTTPRAPAPPPAPMPVVAVPAAKSSALPLLVAAAAAWAVLS